MRRYGAVSRWAPPTRCPCVGDPRLRARTCAAGDDSPARRVAPGCPPAWWDAGRTACPARTDGAAAAEVAAKRTTKATGSLLTTLRQAWARKPGQLPANLAVHAPVPRETKCTPASARTPGFADRLLDARTRTSAGTVTRFVDFVPRRSGTFSTIRDTAAHRIPPVRLWYGKPWTFGGSAEDHGRISDRRLCGHAWVRGRDFCRYTAIWVQFGMVSPWRDTCNHPVRLPNLRSR
jgi:hypothetical protein